MIGSLRRRVGGAAIRLLVGEDDLVARAALQRTLEGDDVEVVAVASCAELLRLLDAEGADAVILGERLAVPESCLDLVVALHSEVPVVVVGLGSADEDQIRAIFRRGASGFISDASDLASLPAALQRLLEFGDWRDELLWFPPRRDEG
jgi:DNA-binding NtrC family response regulator